MSLAFRIGGRILKRFANVGDRVEPDKVLATLDPVDELNALRSATAALSAAEGQLVEASNNFDRQAHLMERGFTTRVNYDQARQGRQTAQARVDDARAQLDQAQDRVSFTELKSTVTGAITARNAEAGEVVQPGQAIFQVAREDGRDAVFDVPAQVLRAAPPDATIDVDSHRRPVRDREGPRAHGRSAGRPRHPHLPGEDEPDRPPRGDAAWRDGDGASRARRRPGHLDSGERADPSRTAEPAVWIVDPATETVSLHNVEVQRFDPGTVVVSGGLAGGDVVVTAGVQALHPGQKVRLLGAAS